MRYAICLALCLATSCGGCDSALAPNDGDGGLRADDASASADASNRRDDAGDSGDEPDAADRGRGDAGPNSGDADSGDTDSGDTDSGDTGSGDTDTLGDTTDSSDGIDDADMPSAAVCGDAVLDPNESCDDGVTTDCLNTHDGGDGTCVSSGSCAAGYVLDGTGACVPNPTGLSTPCANGSGWTMFQFHYSNNSTSAQIDVWDASCSYSFAPNSACNVREVYPGFGEVSRTSDGFPIFTSSNYMRVRFSAAGLNFTNATLWIRARSYATSSSTYYEAWSPLYGGIEGGPVDNDFTYDWYAMDWTGYLSPGDSPSLTAIQLYGGRGSGSLAVRAVELCVE